MIVLLMLLFYIIGFRVSVLLFRWSIEGLAGYTISFVASCLVSKYVPRMLS